MSLRTTTRVRMGRMAVEAVEKSTAENVFTARKAR